MRLRPLVPLVLGLGTPFLVDRALACMCQNPTRSMELIWAEGAVLGGFEAEEHGWFVEGELVVQGYSELRIMQMYGDFGELRLHKESQW